MDTGMALLTITLNMLAKFVPPIFMTPCIADLEILASQEERAYQETLQLAHWIESWGSNLAICGSYFLWMNKLKNGITMLFRVLALDLKGK